MARAQQALGPAPLTHPGAVAALLQAPPNTTFAQRGHKNVRRGGVGGGAFSIPRKKRVWALPRGGIPGSLRVLFGIARESGTLGEAKKTLTGAER